METYITKLKNFWFYHKYHLLIALAALAVIGYCVAQTAGTPQPDYHIGLVWAVPCTDEYLAELETRFAAAGEDVNGDGTVLVQIHTYFVDLADDSENAGVTNAETVAALDADLIGHRSQLFLLEDVDVFQSITNNILSDTVIPFEHGLHLTLRSDAEDHYRSLAEKIS